MSDLDDLWTTIARIGLVSHASTQRYDFDVIHGGGSPGGGRPSGTDRDTPGRRPKPPATPGDDATDETWAWFWDAQAKYERALSEWEDERDAWRASYHRRTPAYFRDELERRMIRVAAIDGGRIVVDAADLRAIVRDLLTEATETLERWERQRIPVGQPPASRADSQWKRYIGESHENTQALADRYKVTARYIQMIRRAYRPETSAAA